MLRRDGNKKVRGGGYSFADFIGAAELNKKWMEWGAKKL
jgi:hypothetical protein